MSAGGKHLIGVDDLIDGLGACQHLVAENCISFDIVAGASTKRGPGFREVVFFNTQRVHS